MKLLAFNLHRIVLLKTVLSERQVHTCLIVSVSSAMAKICVTDTSKPDENGIRLLLFTCASGLDVDPIINPVHLIWNQNPGELN